MVVKKSDIIKICYFHTWCKSQIEADGNELRFLPRKQMLSEQSQDTVWHQYTVHMMHITLHHNALSTLRALICHWIWDIPQFNFVKFVVFQKFIYRVDFLVLVIDICSISKRFLCFWLFIGCQVSLWTHNTLYTHCVLT